MHKKTPKIMRFTHIQPIKFSLVYRVWGSYKSSRGTAAENL